MDRVDIAVVGAGFSGTLLSWHLAKIGVECVLIGDDKTFGRGRAYSTSRTEHLLNVPAGGMSAFPQDADHFRNWLRTIGVKAERSAFMPRVVYGRYLQAISAGSRASKIEDVVLQALPLPGGWELALHSGARIEANRLVLATGHRPPR